MTNITTVFVSTAVLFSISCNALSAENPNVMPTNIQTCKSLDEIKPFLNDTSDIIRKWAVAKLATIKDANVTKELIEVFRKEPSENGIIDGPCCLVRKEVIKTLRKIENPESRKAIETFLAEYLSRGPITKGHTWEDGEYCEIVTTIVAELASYNDENARTTLEKIFNNENLFWGVRDRAYDGLLTIKFSELGLSDPNEQIAYLIRELKTEGLEWVPGKSGVKTLSGLKNGAILWRLTWNYGTLPLPYIDQALQDIAFAKDRNEAVAKRKQALERAKATILMRDKIRGSQQQEPSSRPNSGDSTYLIGVNPRN